MGKINNSENKYSIEYCQNILNKCNSGLTAIEIINDGNFRDIKCIMRCKNESHDDIVNYCYNIERTKPYCKQCKFEKDVAEKYPSGEYVVVGKFVNRTTKIDILHTKCNRIWNTYPKNILRKDGSGCGECYKDFENRSKRSLKDHVEFINEISDKLIGYEVLDKYQHGNIEMHVRHLECGRITPIKPNDVRRNKRKTLCKWCSKEKQAQELTKNHDDYVRDVQKNFPNQFEILSQYTGMINKITVKHLVCGEIYDIYAGNLLRFGSCEHCKTSLGEKVIHRILSNNNYAFEQQKKFDELIGLGSGYLSYDFYLPPQEFDGKAKLIEFNGNQHYEYVEHFHRNIDKFYRQLEHDKLKSEFALDNNMELIIIPYWDFDNIENILKEKLNIA